MTFKIRLRAIFLRYTVGCQGVVQLMERAEEEGGVPQRDPVLPSTIILKLFYYSAIIFKQCTE